MSTTPKDELTPSGESEDRPSGEPAPAALYQRLVAVAIWMAALSLVALGVQSYQNPDPDNAPAPFSCSSLPSLPPTPR